MNTERYIKQIILKEFGIASQQKLLDARVLVVGAGGLGCPALQYLTAAGIGNIGIADFDTVEISNLQRQILYTTEDVGKSKADIAASRLNKLNPDCSIQPFNFSIQNSNALRIISGYDLVIDGSDNFSTRYLINDACVLLDKPMIYGAVFRFEGQVAVFNLAEEKSNRKTNYRDLFPTPPDDASAISCNEAGVIGVLPGIIGILQATEAIKIITGLGSPLCNKILTYNALHNSFYEVAVSPLERSTGTFPETEADFLNFNYSYGCKAGENIEEISLEDFDTLLKNEIITIIDVREMDEFPEVNEFTNMRIPMSIFKNNLQSMANKNKLVIFCQTGLRSLKAANLLRANFPGCTVYSLSGGIKAWKKYHQNISI